MIFQHTHDLIRLGVKTHTMRLVKPDDILRPGPKGFGVYSARTLRPVYIVGRTYAIQPGRGKASVGRIRVTSVDAIPHPLDIGMEIVRREGFAAIGEWLGIWESMHGKRASEPTWGIGFEVVRESKVRR